MEGEPFEGELPDGWLPEGEDGDPDPDGVSDGCAGATTGVCGCDEFIEDDGFPPQATEARRRKKRTTTNPEFV